MAVITSIDQNQYVSETEARRIIRRVTGFKGASVTRWIKMGALPEAHSFAGSPKRYYVRTELENFANNLTPI